MTSLETHLRVLQVIPSVAPASGGPSRAIVDIERALATRGIEVTTVTTDDDGNGGRQRNIAYAQPILTGYAIRFYFSRSLRTYKVSVGLARWLRKNVRNFDVVHIHALFSFAPIVAAYYARKSNVPYVIRPLGVLRQYGVIRRRPWLKKASLALIERGLIESANAVHFTSAVEKEEAEFLGLKCKSAVLPLGIDVDDVVRYQSMTGTEGKPWRLLFLSRLDAVKNIEGLLRAVAQIAPRYPQLILEVAGAGEAGYQKEVQALSESLGLHGRVNWLGFVQGSQKTEILRRATAFVLPSFSESFGIAAAEALAAGLPCIVSTGTGVSRDIACAGAGILVETNPESIAAGIEALISDSERISAMSAAAHRLAREKFSIEAMGDRLIALYRELGKPAVSGSESLLDKTTPMILTFNEEANIDRTLAKLAWAKRVVVVDSGSTDRTLEIIRQYPQAEVLYRKFDTAAQQGNFGLQHVDTEWVLSLDADYVLSEEVVKEIATLQPGNATKGFAVGFAYQINGKSLSGSLYPERVVLYRRVAAHYRDEGHTQRVRIDGQISRLSGVIFHDDRKALERWFSSQIRYAGLEASRLLALDPARRDLMDRLRLMIVPAPFVAFAYALVVKRCALDGWPGWYYALQRLCAEVILSVKILDLRLLRRRAASAA